MATVELTLKRERKKLGCMSRIRQNLAFIQMGGNLMEWRIKLEVKTGWGEVTQVEIASLSRRIIAATDEDIGLSLAEGKAIVAVLQQAIVTTQIDEYVTCARVCRWMR